MAGLLSVTMSLGLASSAFALETDNVILPENISGITEIAPLSLSPELSELKNQFENMSVEELNAFIHEMATTQARSYDDNSSYRCF